MGGYVIWIAFALVSMNVLGISLTSLAVIAGGLSVGIGFGLQNLINNFISGIILLFARTIQPGDIIELNSIWGTVHKVNIRNTEVQTFENAMMFIPNSDLISGQLTNWTHRRDKRMRRDIGVGVAYGSDVEKVKRVLEEIAENDQHVLRYPEPQIIFQNFGASSLDFVLRVWIDSIDYAISTQSELREEIDRRFREESIEISFPQMDLHIRPGDGVLRVER
jgi:small-conductance mechanosensitive channel